VRILDPLIELPGGASRLPAMEGLRAYAAAVVFQVHFFGAWAHETMGIDLAPLKLQSIDEPGLALATYLFRSHYGVDLFFFLSGFLVFGLLCRPGFHYATYLRDRLLRLYPALFVTTVGIAYVHHGWEHLGSANLLANLALLNGVRGLGVAAINTPTWSLLFEFVFYAGFPLVLLGRRFGGRMGAAHVLGAALVFVLATQASPGYAWRGIAFFAGAWLASQDAARVRRWAAALPDAAVLAVFLVATTSFAFFPRFETFAWIFTLPCVVLGVSVLYGDGFLSRAFSARPLRAFGNISYSFYLVHAFAVGVVFHFVRDVLPREGIAGVAGCAATYVASFALSTALAVALFATLERPYFVWKQRRRARTTGRRSIRAASPARASAIPIA
jgi:peptidoglycan/LPS O-acetylase OafA/YrhL